MPAKSKAQQRFMGMVHAVQKDDMQAPSKEVSEAASSISPSDAKDFASTKQKGLPEKKIGKQAADVVSKRRMSPPVHSWMDKIVFGPEERDPPNAADVSNFQNIADYMTASAPTQLNTAKIFVGRHDPATLIKQIDRHKDWDTGLERFRGDRDQISQMISNVTPTAVEQLPALYFPHANSVIMNERSPGALIHELGHAVDLAKRSPGESNVRRWARWNFTPTLLAELHGWKKGRKAYQSGFASSPESSDPKALEQYQKNMDSYNQRKYPAFGTYVGAAGGGLLGAGAGAAAALAAMESTKDPNFARYILPLATLGGVVGGGIGLTGGSLAGKAWANLRADANKAKALKQLEKAKQNPQLAEIAQRLAIIKKQRFAQQQSKDDKKMPKAAEYGVDRPAKRVTSFGNAAIPAATIGGGALAGGLLGAGVLGGLTDNPTAAGVGGLLGAIPGAMLGNKLNNSLVRPANSEEAAADKMLAMMRAIQTPLSEREERLHGLKEGCNKTMKKLRPKNKKQATDLMAAYVRILANKAAKNQKAASDNPLQRLAPAIQKHEDFFRALNEVYADKTAAYRVKIAKGLVKGLETKLANMALQTAPQMGPQTMEIPSPNGARASALMNRLTGGVQQMQQAPQPQAAPEGIQ